MDSLQDKFEKVIEEIGEVEYTGLGSVEDLLRLAVRCRASDLHLTAGTPPVLRIDGRLWRLPELARKGSEMARKEAKGLLAVWPEMGVPLDPKTVERLATELLGQTKNETSIDAAKSVPGLSRFRLNIYRQRGSLAVACRILPDRVFLLDELFAHVPDTEAIIKALATLPRGLVLVTGPAGSGKSTTLAGMVEHVNCNLERHIITLEDPIEYLHKHRKSIINQRELGRDMQSFAEGLRNALREDPDIIVVGEMRDLETIVLALMAAETGHLVLATLHASTAVEAISRVIDVFPAVQQQQIRVQLAGVLQGVLAQQLLPRKDGLGRVCAVEVLRVNQAIRALIREGKIHQVGWVMQTKGADGMVMMDRALADLVRRGLVDYRVAVEKAVDPKQLVWYAGSIVAERHTLNYGGI